MNTIRVRFALLVCAALGLAQGAFAQEPGPTQFWQMIGATTINSNGTVLLQSASGDGYPTVSAAQLSAFFGGVTLPGNSAGSPVDGSGIKTTFSLLNTTPVAFSYQLATDEVVGTGYDRAFVYVDGKQYTLGNNSIANTPGMAPNNGILKPDGADGSQYTVPKGTPVMVLSITGLAPGAHTVGFGVYDTSDNIVPSGVDASDLTGQTDAALGIAVDQREILLGLNGLATRDPNERLLRLRAGAFEPEEGVTTMALALSDGKSTADGKEAKESKETVTGPTLPTVDFYSGGGYGYADRNNLTLSNFVSESYEGSVGVEVHVTQPLTLGLCYTHLGDLARFSGGAGEERIQGNAITPYVSYTMGHFYADALYTYTNDAVDVRRNAGLGSVASANPASNNHSAALDLGYNFTAGQLVTGPFFDLNYTNGELNSYSEAGAVPGSNLVARQQSYDSLLTQVGWQASYRIPTRFGSITPQLRASWERENLDDEDTVGVTAPGVTNTTINVATGSVTTGPFSPTAATPAPERDFLNAGAGLVVNMGSRCSLLLDYEDHLFRSNYSERYASGAIQIKF